jgi:putative Mg2+ transporter-C (MgtC) family protein
VKKKFIIRRVRIKDLDNHDHHIKIMIAVDYGNKITDVYNDVSCLDGVQKVEIESVS